MLNALEKRINFILWKEGEFEQITRKCKKKNQKTKLENKVTEIQNMLEGVSKLDDYRIMHKWSGRQNNGNHPIKTAKRKKKKLWLKTSKTQRNRYPGKINTESPKQDEPKWTHTKDITIKVAKVNERILKTAIGEKKNNTVVIN